MDIELVESKSRLRNWAFAGLTAASFGCILTIVGGDIKTPLAHKAVIVLSAGIVVLVTFLSVEVERDQYHISRLMKIMSLLGLLACLGGIDMFLYNYDHNAGVVALVLFVGMGSVVGASEKRAKKLRAKG